MNEYPVHVALHASSAHGYVYTASTNTSFVPNSRVDSERASVSSGGRTDSDTMSLSSCSMWVVRPAPSMYGLSLYYKLKFNLESEVCIANDYVYSSFNIILGMVDPI